ncbi:hypothetical protein B0H13DRAFT_2328030 [Mycena leptocephala]|nr:hypothetical protein B0H13DRAFT_2328030 [Mycena leptocephala]
MIGDSVDDGHDIPLAPAPTATYRHPNSKARTAANASVEESGLASSAFSPNVTVRRTRANTKRDIDPIPDDAQVLHSPKAPLQTEKSVSTPHRPRPQVVIVDNSDTSDITTSTPEVSPQPGARGGTRSGGRAKRGGGPPAKVGRTSTSGWEAQEKHARAKEKAGALQNFSNDALAATTIGDLRTAFKGLLGFQHSPGYHAL